MKQFRIARKEPYKLCAMLQLVDDTKYRPPGVGRSWLAGAMGRPIGGRSACVASPPGPEDGFETPESTGPSRLAALPAHRAVERLVVAGAMYCSRGTATGWPSKRADFPERLLDRETPNGQLVTDHYAYNNGVEDPAKYADPIGLKAMGMHWVGDLAVECDDVQVGGDKRADLLLEVVEGGVHYTCRIDVSSGKAELSIDGGASPFVDE